MKPHVRDLLRQLVDELENHAKDYYDKAGQPAGHFYRLLLQIKVELGIHDGLFPITSVSRANIKQAFVGWDAHDAVCKRLDKMDDTEMACLAEKMADDYLNQLYWDSLRLIFVERFMRDEE